MVPFEGLASVVDDLRERTCVSKPSHGMPPHVTLLYPAPRDVEAIAEVLVAFSAFEVSYKLMMAPGAPRPFPPLAMTIALPPFARLEKLMY